MSDDLVKRLRCDELWPLDWDEAIAWCREAANRIATLECEITSNATHLDAAMVSIETLEAALYEIVHINNMRDRFSSEIDNVITTALGDKNADA